jgi:protein-S-isoprenylcysteine O-methyltransferase Ste14
MSNALKTILYMGSLHGLLTVYLPCQLASHDKSVIGTGMFGYLAVPCWILGALIILQCSADIIHRGRGTPSHFDPPRLLLLNGWYRRVRNPIYLGSLIVQGGYILWFGSSWVLIYAFLLFLGFQFLIVVIEEPILRNAFGAGYEEYCRRVPRWIPNFK